MQEITYASKTFVTTDALADCLLELVTAIDRQEHSEAVTVPAFTDDGVQVEAKMTLDASSELVAVPVELDLDESFDETVVASALRDLRTRINRVAQTSTATYSDPAEFDDLDTDYA